MEGRKIINRARSFFEKQGISDFSIISGNKTGWRCRVKLAVRGVKIVIGLFEEGSHNVVSALGNNDHHPRINDALERLYEFFLQEHLSAYDEISHTGDIRYVQCVVERRTGLVQVSLVLNTEYGQKWEESLTRLYQRDRLLWHSFWVNVNTKSTNAIFGKRWIHVVGKKYVWESLCGHEIPFLPSHFGQANLEMFERLLMDMEEIVPRRQHVTELYSGMGIISITLRELSRTITLFEIEPSAEKSFKELVTRLPVPLQKGCEFIVGDAAHAQDACARAEIVIVDPPRKGLSEQALQVILQQESVRRVVYVSCSWQTFERDAALLVAGGFSIAWARSYVFFPGTDHLETLCIFIR